MPALALLAMLSAAGCHHAELAPTLQDGPPHEAAADASASMRREWEMNRRWQHRRFSDLKAVLGVPQLIMNIPGGGNPPGFAAVYGRDPASGCIDAFALLNGADPIVRVYHCR